MKRLQIVILSLFMLITLLSCGSESEPLSGPSPEVISAPLLGAIVEETPPLTREPAFNPVDISQEVFDSTKVEVQKFIMDLNQIIRGRNYNAWRTVLSDDYFRTISSSQFLATISDLPAMKTRKIVLKNPQDYFNYVVVPSRANDRVDDIEFLSRNRVKVYTLNANGERLRLYDLEHTGNTWIIIN
ncbi:MAG: hypothetical protein LBK62_08955 [Treponema sp.]|jgi:hypothetical protein|nr:hypothetical protein [Treponema sp.]